MNFVFKFIKVTHIYDYVSLPTIYLIIEDFRAGNLYFRVLRIKDLEN